MKDKKIEVSDRSVFDHPYLQPCPDAYRRWATRALRQVLAQEPSLNFGGFDYCFVKNTRSPLAERVQAARDSREEMRTRLAVDEDVISSIAASAAWIARQKLVKTFDRNIDSYGYKHLVERWFEHEVYVSAGSFIVAALSMNIRYKRNGSQIFCPFSKTTRQPKKDQTVDLKFLEQP